MVQITSISGFKIMWNFVMFDLPTEESEQRKEYREFRNILLDLSYLQLQYSVYAKCFPSKERAESSERVIQKYLPQGGKVYIFSITDKQYAQMRIFYGKQKQKKLKTNEHQLLLF